MDRHAAFDGVKYPNSWQILREHKTLARRPLKPSVRNLLRFQMNVSQNASILHTDKAKITPFQAGKSMETLKQEAMKAISALPENVELEEIMYKLYVIDKVRKGEKAIEEGKKITSEELKKEVSSW